MASDERKVAVVTGTTSGLGQVLAEDLARRGWDLVLLNRSAARTRPLLERLAAQVPGAQAEVVEADLADQDAVCEAARTIGRRHPRLHALFNNAAVLLGDLSYSPQDVEMHFQVNTLAPYLLMRRLRLSLAAAGGATMLNVSSGAIFLTGPLGPDDLRRPPRLRKLFGAYAQSKLALTTLTNALAADYRRDGILLRSMDPGINRTAMTAGPGMPAVLRPWRFGFRPPSRGARAILDAALAPTFGDRTGVFIAGGRIKTPPNDADDPAIQNALLTLCRDLTGV